MGTRRVYPLTPGKAGRTINKSATKEALMAKTGGFMMEEGDKGKPKPKAKGGKKPPVKKAPAKGAKKGAKK